VDPSEATSNGFTVSLIITTTLAVLGLMATVSLTLLQRRDTTRIHQRTTLHESSRQLASSSPAERAVGMAAAIDHLDVDHLGISARRITINALHYEDDPLIIYRGLQGLSNPKFSKTVIEELLIINRQLWQDLLVEFGVLCLDSQRRVKYDYFEQRLGVLRQNQRLVSHLLQGGQFEGLDFSDTFYPDLHAPGIVFSNCRFNSCFLHYSNLRAATFRECDFSRAILIGSYLEKITFSDCELGETIALAARPHLTKEESEELLPAELNDTLWLRSPSFLYQIEQDWRGYWFGEVADRERLLTRPRSSLFDAYWQNTSGDRVHARIIMEDHQRFQRTDSSDRNDGVYKMTRKEFVDRPRSVTLTGGVRVLASGVPSGWRAIWWERLFPEAAITVPPPTEAEELRRRNR
jgi:hypothetical protein